MSITAVVYHQIENITQWTSSTLNSIIITGNNLYSTIKCSVRNNDYLLLTDVPAVVSIHDKVYQLQYSESFTGSLFMASNNGPYLTLQNSLVEIFFNFSIELQLFFVDYWCKHCCNLQDFLKKDLKFLTPIHETYMECPIRLENVFYLVLKDSKTLCHI